MSHFAESLKLRRQELGLTMQAVADKASVSKSMICKIERDEVQPTLDVACRIAQAVDKPLSEMLHLSQGSRVVFLPKAQQAVWEDSNQIKRRNISPVFEGLKLEWLQVEMPGNTSSQKCIAMNIPGVEKYILVTKGRLEVHVDKEVFMVEEGDSLYFDGRCAYQYCNVDNQDVLFYVLVKYG